MRSVWQTKFVPTCLWLGALALVVVTAACGGGGGGSGPPAPTVTGVAPNSGLEAGGTAITITGTEFAAGATVAVGGNPASAVVVVNATTITCDTPAGTGTAGVSVTTAGGTASLPAAFTYSPPPTVAAVSPARVETPGGASITITGTGFMANGAEPNDVSIGGAMAPNVTTVDDTTITCDVPAGTNGPAAIAVTNANGTGMLPGGVTYFTRGVLYYSEDDNANGLYVLDTLTGIATLSGAGESGVTGRTVGLAPGAIVGTLHGSTFGDILLVEADGSGTLLVSTESAEGLAFHGPSGLLYCGINNAWFTVDPATGLRVADLTSMTVDLEGFAPDDANGRIYAIGDDPNLWVYEIATDTWTVVADMGMGNWDSAGLAYDPELDVLYAVSSDQPDSLYMIDPVSGVPTLIGALGLGTGQGGGLAVLPAP